MRFINYCVIVMKDTHGVIDEIKRISETVPNILDAKGILIATFTSAIEPKELNDWFTSNGFNFLFFELNPDSSGFNLMNKKLHEGLFGFLNNDSEYNVKDKEAKFMDLLASTVDKTKGGNCASLLTEKDINAMSETQKRELCDKMLDSGIENLSENDKKLLQLLVK